MRSDAMMMRLALVALAHVKALNASATRNAQGSIDEMADKLVDRLAEWTLKVGPTSHADLDYAMLGKAGHLPVCEKKSAQTSWIASTRPLSVSRLNTPDPLRAMMANPRPPAYVMGHVLGAPGQQSVQRSPLHSVLKHQSQLVATSASRSSSETGALVSADDPEILLKVCRGERAERTPAWLMRQAGRYMAAFREYSDRLPFRERSETPEIAFELSMQPLRAFGLDGVIFFSDILTPLPALGIDFDVVKGKGPVIPNPVRTAADVDKLQELGDAKSKLPFISETLGALRKETEGKCTLLGFVGAPWTLAAYSNEGGSAKHCLNMKGMMSSDPDLAHRFVGHLAKQIGEYACYQVESGAQVIQVFESWAHHLSPEDFEKFARPYAIAVAKAVKARYPEVPVLFYANGGSSYLERQRNMEPFDMISLDWHVDLRDARARLGESTRVAGNVDPSILRLGNRESIYAAVADCIDQAGGPGRHVLNLGHGVMQNTPEENVQHLVDAARSMRVGTSPH